MKDYAVYLDLDGVLADYDAGIQSLGFNIDPAVKNDLNRSKTDNPLKREMYEKVKGTDYYYNLPFMPGALELYKVVQAAEPIILTAGPKFGATEDDYFVNPYWLGAAYHKRRWVEEKLLPRVKGAFVHENFGYCYPTRIPIPDDRFVCTTSARKAEFMHRKHSSHQILIDDRITNCQAWAAAGGLAILHTMPATDTLKILKWYQDGVRGAGLALMQEPGSGVLQMHDNAGRIRTYSLNS